MTWGSKFAKYSGILFPALKKRATLMLAPFFHLYFFKHLNGRK